MICQIGVEILEFGDDRTFLDAANDETIGERWLDLAWRFFGIGVVASFCALLLHFTATALQRAHQIGRAYHGNRAPKSRRKRSCAEKKHSGT